MTNSVKPPVWFWVVSVLALLWNAFGVFQYLYTAFNQVEILETLNQAQREVFEAMPAWATACFAIATFGGLAASIGLFIRKKWSKMLFIVSLVAAIAQFVNWLFIQNAAEVFPNSYAMPVTVVIVGVLLILFSNTGIKKGWLK